MIRSNSFGRLSDKVRRFFLSDGRTIWSTTDEKERKNFSLESPIISNLTLPFLCWCRPGLLKKILTHMSTKVLTFQSAFHAIQGHYLFSFSTWDLLFCVTEILVCGIFQSWKFWSKNLGRDENCSFARHGRWRLHFSSHRCQLLKSISALFEKCSMLMQTFYRHCQHSAIKKS